MSTFFSLFKHGLRDFSGLKIEPLWTDRNYPVVWLDFSELDASSSLLDFEDSFRRLVTANFADAGYRG